MVWAVKHYRHYLYGHRCQVYTDHEALKSLLNAPHPSGKLARWGHALQEVNLVINYRPGKGNSNADALSRNPATVTSWDGESPPFAILAAIQPTAPSEGGDPVPRVPTVDPTLQESQRADPESKLIFDYLEEGILPTEERRAREMVLGKSQFAIVDGVLYHLEKDKSLRIIPPVEARRKLFNKSTLESPFYLMYGRDPQLPTDAILVPEPERKYVEVQDFRSEMVMGISQAWKLARENIEQAQKYQKSQHDKHAKDPNFKLGDRVFVHMPAEKRGKAYKFARTFHGPFRVVELLENGVRVVPVDKPQESPVRVALN